MSDDFKAYATKEEAEIAGLLVVITRLRSQRDALRAAGESLVSAYYELTTEDSGDAAADDMNRTLAMCRDEADPAIRHSPSGITIVARETRSKFDRIDNLLQDYAVEARHAQMDHILSDAEREKAREHVRMIRDAIVRVAEE